MGPLAEILDYIKTYAAFLTNHSSYISKIQEGKVNYGDINYYLKDAFNISCDNEITGRLLIAELEKVVDDKLKSCIDFVKAALIKNKDHALCLLYLMCEKELKYAEVFKMISNSDKVDSMYKVKTTLDGFNYLNYISAVIKPHLPKDICTLLLDIIKFKSQREKDTAFRFQVNIKPTWSNARDDCARKISECQEKMEIYDKLNKENAKILFSTENLIGRAAEFNDSLTSLLSTLDALKGKNYPTIQKIVEDFFIMVLPDYSKINNTLLFLTEKVEEATQICKLYEYHKAIIIDSYSTLEKQSKQLKRWVKKNKIAEVVTKIEKIEKELLISKEQSNFKLNDIEETSAVEDYFSQARNQISTHANSLNALQSEAIQYLANKKRSHSVEKTLTEENVKAKVEREKYLKEQEQKCLEYKASILKLREEKQKLKSQIDNEKISFSEEIKPKDDSILIDKNLTDLNHNELILLQSIIKLNKKIDFNQVCNLISKLGGKVSQIGNGSSHMRITLKKLAIAVVSYGEIIDEQSTIAGTIVRNHGKSHTNHNLSPFNVKVLMGFFTKIGITLEVVSTLLTNKVTTSSNSTIFLPPPQNTNPQLEGASSMGISFKNNF